MLHNYPTNPPGHGKRLAVSYALTPQGWSQQWLAFLAVAFLSLFLATAALAQDPGVGGTRANFEVDADFKSGFIPTFWNATNYTPTNKPLGDDWSKGPTGNAVLKQVGGVSVPGVTDDRRSIWKVDGNSGSNSAVAEGSTFAGSSNKNGDNIAPGQNPYLIQLGGSTPQKNDITNTYLHGRNDSNGDLWIFFAAETRSTDGASYVDFEYNQAGVGVKPNGPQFNLTGNGPVGGRTVGDVLLVINYEGGGNKPVVGVRIWQANASWSDELPLTDIEAFVTTNATNIDPVAPNRAFTGDGAFANVTAALQLVEGGINITSLNLGGNFNPCSPVSTVTVKTRSSPSYTSELKDYDILQFSAIPPATLSALSPATKCENENAVFSTTVEGDGALAANVQWYFNNVLLSNGGKYAITPNGSTSTLTVSGVSLSEDEATYTVEVTGTCGTVTKNVALTVNPVTGAADIAPLTRCVGQNATFTTVASGTGPFTYVWNKDGVTIPNENGPSLTLSSVTEADEATYTVEVTGACSAVSKSADLTVNPLTATTDLSPLTLCVGSTATFTTTASGTGPFTYVWKKDGVTIPNENGASLTLASITEADEATYSVEVTGACGSATESATLTVNTTATATNLVDLTKCVGQSATFSTSASGTGPFTYVWKKNGMVIPGENGASLTIAAVTEADEAEYCVEATGSCGTATRCAALVVNDLTAATDLTALTKCVGQSATFSTTASGTGPFTYVWKKDGVTIPNENGSSLTVAAVTEADEATYSVEVTGTCGTVTKSADLTVNPLTATTDLSPLTLCVGSTATFSTTASGTGPFTYVWKKNGMVIPGENGASLTLTSITEADEATYSVEVTGTCGSASESASLVVNEQAAATDLVALAKCAGESATFSTTASGTGPFTYVWKKNGMVIPGENGSSLTVTSVSEADEATYSVEVTGDCGTVTKSAPLVVNPVPTAAPSAVAACVGGVSTATISANASGGIGTYSYEWTVPAGASNPGNVANFTATVPGTYSVVVTDNVAGNTACAGTVVSVTPVFVPCGTGAGCTPGYWKNRKLTWNTVSYGNVTRDVRGCVVESSNALNPRYTPVMAVPAELKTALFRVVFDLTAKQVEARLGKGTGNLTLLQALGLGDGSGYTQLARAGTAGLLNSCAMNYAPGANPVITSQSIVSDVRARFLSSNRNAALALALRYDQYNNSTCIIDNSGTLATVTTTATARQGAPTAGEATAAITVTAFPNPAYGEATIEFSVPTTSQTALSVYNIRGDKVKTLFEGVAEGGKTYRVTLKSDDRIVPGAYIYRLQAGSDSKSSRLIMLKQ